MFERFTERARQVVVLAQDEARLLEHDYIGTEHLLLGLLREEEGLAAKTLESLDVTLEGVRAQVGRTVGPGESWGATGQIPFTPRAKKVLELSLREALSLGHNFIGTEHVLLGLTREGDGVAMQVLGELGVAGELVRASVIERLGGPPTVPSGAQLHGRALPRSLTRRAGARRSPRPPSPLPLLVAYTLGALTLGIGILIGWAIWGA